MLIYPRLVIALLLVSGTVFRLGCTAQAQSNTIRLIIGMAPGGAIDPYARLIAPNG